jgi:hypothetical protein
MDILIAVLRAVHIVGGVIWAGWAFSLALFIQPAVAAMGQQGGSFMQAVTQRTQLVKVMSYTSLAVILSGIWLLWIVSSGFSSLYMGSTHGITLSIGVLLGILAYGHGMSYMRPRAARMGQIGAAIAASGQPPTPEQLAEMGRISGEIQSGSKLTAWILGITVLTMAIHRYLH